MKKFAYSGKPKSDNKEFERLTWQLHEQQQIGTRVFIVVIVSLLISLLVLHSGFLLAICIAIVLAMFTVIVMKDAHDKAFDKYWDYWQTHK